MARYFPPPHQQVVEAAVVINRSVSEVFTFYRDLRNLPRFLGDVLRVEQLDATTYRWTIAGPLGTRAHTRVRITAEKRNEVVCYETLSSSRWTTRWQVRFSPGLSDGDTQVREIIEMPIGLVGRVALAVIGKFPADEVRSNLHRLKELLETGTISDHSHAIRGKFARPARWRR